MIFLKRIVPFLLLITLVASSTACSPEDNLAEVPFTSTTPHMTLLTRTVLSSQIPKPLPTATAVLSSQVILLTVQSSMYPKPIPTRIYLPPGYNPERREPYPLLVLLHGSNADGSQWEQLGILHAADMLIQRGEIEPLVIFMPEETYSLQPYDETTFGKALVEEVIPNIRAQYNLCATRECCSIGGLSRGAAWAARLALTYWDTFGAAGLHSMPINLPPLPQWIKEIPEGSMPRFYLDIGNEDVGYKNATQFEATLNLLNIPHEWIVQPGDHSEKYWSSHVEDYLRWYDAGWVE